MCRWLSTALVGVLALGLAGFAMAQNTPWSGLGRAATEGDIAVWDIDVRPDGTGLPKGSGSVSQGQDIYDAQCAVCHGTFGESSEYMALAGGIGTLRDATPTRTTGSKLNYATTLWDYINRAMPFQTPKTLTVDEVYALTACILHLNDILPADATLDEQSILVVKMPNVDGFTQDHGFKTRDGKPDVHNTACMSHCTSDVRVTSALPEYARDAHGNLADQVRLIGPYRGVVTTVAKAPSVSQMPSPAGKRTALELINQKGCLGCHGIERKLVGPGFQEVATKYQGQADADTTLAAKIKLGGVGTWGQVPMPPQAQLSDAEINIIVAWVLTGAARQ